MDLVRRMVFMQSPKPRHVRWQQWSWVLLTHLWHTLAAPADLKDAITKAFCQEMRYLCRSTRVTRAMVHLGGASRFVRLQQHPLDREIQAARTQEESDCQRSVWWVERR